MPLFRIGNADPGDQSLFNETVDAINGQNDIGAIEAYAQISPPGAPTVAVNAVSGNLTGNYQYAVAHVTGYWKGPVGTGTLFTKGNTGGGAASITVSPNAQQVNLSNLPIGPTGTVARIIYRTKANGSAFFVLAQLNDNTSTTFPDNIADANLGAAMPTTNTTGSKFVGDGSGLTNLPIAPVNNATPSAAGIVETAQSPSGTPVVSTRVADQEPEELTTTSASTVATFTPIVSGFFDIACHFRITANVSVGIQVTYAGSQGALTTTILNSTAYTYNSAAGADNDYDTIPVTIRAVAGTAINVQFTASVANAVCAASNITGR